MKKGYIPFIAEFAIAIFLVLLVVILVLYFKAHMLALVTDFFVWGKEYDTPLALFSIDIWNENAKQYESSVVAMNKIYYSSQDSNSLGDGIKKTLDFWFPQINVRERTRSYSIKFGNKEINKEFNWEECRCADQNNPGKGEVKDKCTSECGPNVGNGCNEDVVCKPEQKVVQQSYSDVYPLPLIDKKVTKLEFNSSVAWWIQ
jgi:hypothetical protein